MAERLTEKDSIDNKRYMLNSEDNQITLTYAKLNNGFRKAYYWGKPIDKLAKLEDMLEKYGIDSVEELDKKLADGITWQKACELACKWFKQTGFIGDQTEVDYFYQQAKKERNDE